jgi:hypothetical protein
VADLAVFAAEVKSNGPYATGSLLGTIFTDGLIAVVMTGLFRRVAQRRRGSA